MGKRIIILSILFILSKYLPLFFPTLISAYFPCGFRPPKQ
jgi:hypothetical protein